MKIETTQVTKLLISDLMAEPQKLDPVTVILEDHAPGKGRIIIECYGKSWSSYWGAMGKETIAQFFATCSADYLIGNLDPQLQSGRFSGEALVELARKTIISRRADWRGRDRSFTYLEKEECRRLYDKADELRGHDSIDQAITWDFELLQEVFDTTEPWHFVADATEPNPDYLYLERIVGAVQQALLQLEAPAEAA